MNFALIIMWTVVLAATVMERTPESWWMHALLIVCLILSNFELMALKSK